MTKRFVDDVVPSQGEPAIPTVRTLLRRLGQIDAPIAAQEAAVRAWCLTHEINASLAADLHDYGWGQLAPQTRATRHDRTPLAL